MPPLRANTARTGIWLSSTRESTGLLPGVDFVIWNFGSPIQTFYGTHSMRMASAEITERLSPRPSKAAKGGVAPIFHPASSCRHHFVRWYFPLPGAKAVERTV